MAETNRLIVGIDGTARAVAAARWAGAVADKYGAALDIVHAAPALGHNLSDAGAAARADTVAYHRENSAAFVKTALEAVLADFPRLIVRPRFSDLPAADALIEASASARLLVLSSAKVSPVGALLLGSTTLAVVRRGLCPVTVWRGGDLVPDGSAVVVGVDYAPAGMAALISAMEFASRVAAPLRVVHCWSTLSAAERRAIPWLVDWKGWEHAETERLNHTLDAYRMLHPDVDIECFVEPYDPSHSLLRHGTDAQLVVVGTGGRNPVTGVTLGSTTLNMLQHCKTPVMVCHGTRHRR